VKDATSFLMGGGTKTASWKHKPVGFTWAGVIVRDPEVRQQTDIKTKEPKFFKGTNDPMLQLVVAIQTSERDPLEADDDGVRAIYVKGKQFTAAVRDAVKATGAKGLETGGTLAVTYIGDGPQASADMDPPKLFSATYTRPVVQAAADFLNGGDQPAMAPVQPTYQQPTQPVYQQPAAAQPAAAPPASIPPAVWAAMNPDQQRQVLAAQQQAMAGSTPPF
jgi:hypothetical protein